MQQFKNLVPLRIYCRENEWPRLPQWNHWITAKKPVARKCVKKVGGRYLVDTAAFQEYLAHASLEEEL